jgi:hypothetical protein
LQELAYPVYADTVSILGSTELEYLPCCPENQLCPPLSQNSNILLGWTIVPKALRFTDDYRLHDDFERIASTFFNGPSLISEARGIAALSEEEKKGERLLASPLKPSSPKRLTAFAKRASKIT